MAHDVPAAGRGVGSSGFVSAVVVVSCLLGRAAAAEPQDRQAFAVELAAVGDWQTAFHERTATPAGDLLEVAGFDMTRPAVVAVEPVEPGVLLDVALYKLGEREPVRRGEPDAEGAVLLAFRTYDEVGIEVRASRPTPYRLAVLLAPPVKKTAPSPFVAPPRTGGSLAAALPWVIAAGVLVALASMAVLVGWLLWRRASGAAAAVVALAVAASLGLVSPPRIHAQGYRPPSQPVLDAGQAVLFEKNLKKQEEFLKKYENLYSKSLTLLQSLQKLAELSPKDLAYEPQLAPPGMPKVPLACAVDPECRSCYAPAYEELSAVRGKLENNRIVLANFTRRMDAIDAAASGLGGMHYGLGIVALKHRAEWNAQRNQIGGQYDQRYGALLGELQAALRKIEACEAKTYGTPAWYERFGYMYYEFMAARYRRTGGGL